MINIVPNQITTVNVDEEWNFGDDVELSMHTIHAYPAKFPAFIASKAFGYAQQEGVNIKAVADVFCGCGTVALEAKLHEKNFWGCDMNPVATLIAKVKSKSYKVEVLDALYEKIVKEFKLEPIHDTSYSYCNERIRYWFTEGSFNDLYRLKNAIFKVTLNGKYREAFLCLFSSILKASSKWLTKSIKPQVDPQKKEIDIFYAFSRQYQKLIRSINQIHDVNPRVSNIEIKKGNFLTMRNLPEVDMIISSPPYVTSYEYADLHQLSTLWLGYAEDYRSMRKGSVGSIYNSECFHLKMNEINVIGRAIVQELRNGSGDIAMVRSIARYYIDIQKVIQKCSRMLNNGGMALFVVGDTEYKGSQIKNSEHLIKCFIDEGFTDIKAAKRRISNKLLTPYRDSAGKFSSDKAQRTIYHEEFIISGRMMRL